MVLVRPEEIAESQQNLAHGEASVKVRAPKKVLHFSDGVLEEYSTDEEVDAPKEEKSIVNPADLSWGPWMWYKTWRAGELTLGAIDTVGEVFASFFGITTPRYYFELEEYKRRQELKRKAEDEARGWSGPSSSVEVNMPLREMSTSNQADPVFV